MIELSQAQQCKQLASKGMAIKEIAKTLGLARNTVRGYVRGDRVAGEYRRSKARVQPAREVVRTRVEELLRTEQEKATPRKQRLTGARIYRLLDGEGLAVSERTCRTVVREVRFALRDALEHAYLPLEYRPSEDAQVDFFEAVADHRQHGRIKFFVLLVRACFSGRTYAYVAPNQTRESLLEGLMQAFEFFGGVFTNVWFDNLTPAVKKVLEGRDRIMQDAFKAFVAHYGFTPQFCRPSQGNEKGGVEGEVNFSRHEMFSPIPEIADRSDLKCIAQVWMDRDESRTIRGRDRTIGEMWSDEIGGLIPLPAVRFEASKQQARKVTNRSWVQYGTNFYSTPVAWVGCDVTLKVEAERVVIVGRGGERAEHARLFGQGQMSLDLDHYLPLLERKHRGLDRAVPVRRFLEKADVCWPMLLRELRNRGGEVQGSKDFVEVLKLNKTHGLEQVTGAIRKTLRSGEVSLSVIRFYVWNRIEETTERLEQIDYPGPAVRQGSTADYSALLRGEEVARG